MLWATLENGILLSFTATNGHGHAEWDSSSVSVGTARNIRIPAQRQFRTAGWIFNKTKVSSEKRQSSDEQREVFDWTDSDNDERIRDLPTPTGRTFPTMQENDGGTPNALRQMSFTYLTSNQIGVGLTGGTAPLGITEFQECTVRGKATVNSTKLRMRSLSFLDMSESRVAPSGPSGAESLLDRQHDNQPKLMYRTGRVALHSHSIRYTAPPGHGHLLSLGCQHSNKLRTLLDTRERKPTCLPSALFTPIATVTQLHPIIVTWHRNPDDPADHWFLEGSQLGVAAVLTMPVSNPGDQVGEVVVTFTTTGLYDLVAAADFNLPAAAYVVQIESLLEADEAVQLCNIDHCFPFVGVTLPEPPTPLPQASETVHAIFSLSRAVSATSADSSSITPTSSTVTLTFSSTSTDSSSIPPLPSSLKGTSSILLPSDSSNTGKNTNIPTIVGGSVGAGLFVLIIPVFLLCRRKGKRGVHTSKGPYAWEIITPFRWSSHSIDQTSGTSAGLDNQLGGGERNDSEVATNGRGDGELDTSSVSAGTARNVRIPVQRQFRIAGWIFNKTKVSSEKRQSSDEQREVFDWTDHDNDERIRDLPIPTGRTFPAMQENGGGRPNALRHLDSGIRIMQFYRPELARGQRMSQRHNGETCRGHDLEVVEDAIGLPPEYSSHRRSRILDFKPAKWGFGIVKACSRVRGGLRINPIYRDFIKKGKK
ncbi:hypothetical protein K435DRAFT_923756 [Dendrothele bispora CBS 962.96]|uniref:Uncharacterized protein n=1 Tax=Dendrothele bispora (strain CBS 962.96) TaxID=1314807 RepID=A0A4S8MH01_DENBC|nr:hypothetical protein K435DRAFT_923756 [Dendrothele bispora CBS 962.96]